ncbi:MAG TPA: helix-turn-helix domain-containing protein [Nakamurella sp.]
MRGPQRPGRLPQRRPGQVHDVGGTLVQHLLRLCRLGDQTHGAGGDVGLDADVPRERHLVAGPDGDPLGRSRPPVETSISSPARSASAPYGARGALEIVLDGGRSGLTVTVDRLGVAGLLLQLDDPAPLVAFADRSLAAVRRHDEPRGTQLLDTLRCYLGNRQNRAATAAALHLHPNTVTQRLQRVESLTGLDLADAEAVVQIRAALTVLDVARVRLEDGVQ